MLEALELPQLVTILCGVLDPVAGTATQLRAGHLLPVLVHADQTPELLVVPSSPPLGAGNHAREIATFVFRSGDMLLAVTDGLVERRSEDLDAGLDRVLAAATVLLDGVHPRPRSDRNRPAPSRTRRRRHAHGRPSPRQVDNPAGRSARPASTRPHCPQGVGARPGRMTNADARNGPIASGTHTPLTARRQLVTAPRGDPRTFASAAEQATASPLHIGCPRGRVGLADAR